MIRTDVMRRRDEMNEEFQAMIERLELKGDDDFALFVATLSHNLGGVIGFLAPMNRLGQAGLIECAMDGIKEGCDISNRIRKQGR